MTRTRVAARRGRALSAAIGAPLALLLIGTLAACTAEPGQQSVAPASAVETVPIYAGVTLEADIPYPSVDGGTQLLDVCSPSDATASAINAGPARAIVLVHGGSWREGDKANPWWRSTCEWLASEGFVTFNINYRLAPDAPFPSAIEDLQAAVSWVRHPDQVVRYGYDPALIGAFGGSAGGNLVSLLGTAGSGPLDTGSRVAAVVELSGPTDLTAGGLDLGVLPEGFEQIQLDYLACESYSACAVARAASPKTHIDPSDPPFFIGHSIDEYIPVGHARDLAAALDAADVPVTLMEVEGAAHSIGLLGTLEPMPIREDIIAFLRESLR
jgi:acetyl esterase